MGCRSIGGPRVLLELPFSRPGKFPLTEKFQWENQKPLFFSHLPFFPATVISCFLCPPHTVFSVLPPLMAFLSLPGFIFLLHLCQYSSYFFASPPPVLLSWLCVLISLLLSVPHSDSTSDCSLLPGGLLPWFLILFVSSLCLPAPLWFHPWSRLQSSL